MALRETSIRFLSSLIRFLSREAALNGDAERDAVRQKLQIDRELPGIWRRMLSEPDKELVAWVRKRITDEHEFSPSADQVANVIVETVTPNQPTYSNKPANSGFSREVDKRPSGYTLFGDSKPWRSGIGMWVDVVEQVYYRHKSDFLQKAKKRLRLTPGSNLILIFETPLNKDRDWKETGVPGIFVYSNLKVIRFIELAYKLLELFEHSPSDLHFHFNGEGAKPIDYGSKPANTGFSREVDERPIGYSLFGDYRPWRSGIGMWADVVEQVYSRYENNFLEKAQKLRLVRSNYFLRDGVLISDDLEKINRPRGPIKPRKTSVPLYIERSLKVDVLIELAYELLKLFGHPPSDLQIHE